MNRMFSDSGREGDNTRKVRIVARSEMESVEAQVKIVKRFQFWITIAAGLVGVGFSLAMYLNRYAATADVDKLADKQDNVSKQLSDHIVNETSRLSAVEAQGKDIEADYHWQREQLSRIAERVGARRVAPPPEHKKEIPHE